LKFDSAHFTEKHLKKKALALKGLRVISKQSKRNCHPYKGTYINKTTLINNPN